MGREEREQEDQERERLFPTRENGDALKVYDRHKQPTSLKDIYRGCSMFVVCGGPSLNTIDKRRLTERGIVSIGVNNVAGHVQTDWMVCSDPPEKFSHDVWFDPKIGKLIPMAKQKKKIRIKYDGKFASVPFRTKDLPNVFFFDRNCEFKADEFLTRDSASWGSDKEWSEKTGEQRLLFTFFLGLRLAHYFGANEAYLLGVDFNMNKDDQEAPAYAFDQAKHAGARRTNHGSYRKAIKWCEQIAPEFEKAGMKVFNCNPLSDLKVWPHVGFDQAIEACRGSFVSTSPDLKDWYLKYDKDGKQEDG